MHTRHLGRHSTGKLDDAGDDIPALQIGSGVREPNA